MKAKRGEYRYSFTYSLTSALEWRVGGQCHSPAALPRVMNRILIAWKAEGPQRCVENLVLTGIRSPDRPVCSESLYRLCYPGSCHDHSFVELEAVVLPYQQDSVYCYPQAVTFTEHSISITCMCTKHYRWGSDTGSRYTVCDEQLLRGVSGK